MSKFGVTINTVLSYDRYFIFFSPEIFVQKGITIEIQRKLQNVESAKKEGIKI